MKKNSYSLSGKWAALLFLAFICYSCEETKKPPRKKMPELNGFSVPENERSSNVRRADGLPFATADIDMMVEGTIHSFLKISLPYAADDSIALNLFNQYRPFAVPLLSQWNNMRRDGVVIDLRSQAGGYSLQADFVIEKHNTFSIPVVFMWDRSSASRAAAFMNMLHELPVSCRRISGTDAMAKWRSASRNCFMPVNQEINYK